MIKYLLGDIDPALFGASLIVALLGAFLVMLLGTKLRDPNSPSSPSVFSWSYLFSDNFKRMLANLIAIVLVLRFMPEIFGTTLTMWQGLIVGISSDSLALLIKQKTTWLDPKDKKDN